MLGLLKARKPSLLAFVKQWQPSSYGGSAQVRTLYVTRSRKRGPFPQISDCELDLSADSAKSVVHARENRLTLARSVPKLQSFEHHTRAYLGFEISAFVAVL